MFKGEVFNGPIFIIALTSNVPSVATCHLQMLYIQISSRVHVEGAKGLNFKHTLGLFLFMCVRMRVCVKRFTEIW